MFTVFHARTASTEEALLAYGSSEAAATRQAARLLSKVLQGADAGDLPVEPPTRFGLVVNLRTARALGVAVPPALLLRADQVIE